MPLPTARHVQRISRNSGDASRIHGNRLYTRLANPRLGRCAGFLLLGLVTLPVGCKTGLVVRKDAGQAADADRDGASPDVAAEVLPPSDISPDDATSPDLTTADLADVPPAGGVPKGFRFVNHTDRTAHVRVEMPIACRMQSASAWQDCSFFALGCTIPCSSVAAGDNCCLLCEQTLPSLFVIPPGASQAVPWSGSLYARVTGACSLCQCLEETPVASGTFEASASVFADYECTPMPSYPCQSAPDGTLMMAIPRGSASNIVVPFTVPHPGEEVVLDITSLPVPDAGTPQDLATAG